MGLLGVDAFERLAVVFRVESVLLLACLADRVVHELAHGPAGLIRFRAAGVGDAVLDSGAKETLVEIALGDVGKGALNKGVRFKVGLHPFAMLGDLLVPVRGLSTIALAQLLKRFTHRCSSSVAACLSGLATLRIASRTAPNFGTGISIGSPFLGCVF